MTVGNANPPSETLISPTAILISSLPNSTCNPSSACFVADHPYTFLLPSSISTQLWSQLMDRNPHPIAGRKIPPKTTPNQSLQFCHSFRLGATFFSAFLSSHFTITHFLEQILHITRTLNVSSILLHHFSNFLLLISLFQAPYYLQSLSSWVAKPHFHYYPQFLHFLQILVFLSIWGIFYSSFSGNPTPYSRLMVTTSYFC